MNIIQRIVQLFQDLFEQIYPTHTNEEIEDSYNLLP